MIFKLPHIKTEDTFIRVQNCFRVLFWDDEIIQKEDTNIDIENIYKDI